jgi:hypothetical protein
MSASEPAVTDLVAQAKAQASSPLQREFARLLSVIEKTAAQVQEMERLHGMYRAKFGQVLPPLKAQQDDLSRHMVLFLHERLQRPDAGKTKSLTASNRKAIGRLIVSLSMDFAMQGDAQMRAIHDLYSNETIDEMDEAGLDDVLDMLDQMGMEMPEIMKKDGSKASAAEAAQAALRAIQEKVREQDEIEAQRKARRDEKRAAKAKADPKAQAKLAQKEQAAQDAQNALKNIYRQLARQLHPDRAANDTQRALNHDLMSEANTAYERQDLLALLKLQLKASQIDANAMSTVAEDKLKSWVALLRAQAKDLEIESAQLQMQMVHEFRVPPRQVISAAAIEQSLQAAVQDYDEALHLMRSDLELVKNDADLKRWAKANSKDLERHDALLEDDLLDAMMMEQMMSATPRKTKKKR